MTQRTVATVAQAVRVLEHVQHRGVRAWRYDRQTMRVMPDSWNERDLVPSFTPFEVVCIARRLQEIGAVTPQATRRKATP